MIYNQRAKNIQKEKNSLFSKWCWGNWTATCKRRKLEPCLTPDTKINSKWAKDLNVRPETITFLEENTGSKLLDINLTKLFLGGRGVDTKAKTTKTKINKLDYIKLKSFCTAKETIIKIFQKAS